MKSASAALVALLAGQRRYAMWETYTFTLADGTRLVYTTEAPASPSLLPASNEPTANVVSAPAAAPAAEVFSVSASEETVVLTSNAPAPAPAPIPAPSPPAAALGKPNTAVVGQKLSLPSSDSAATAMGASHGRAKLIITGFYDGFYPSRITAYLAAARAAGAQKIVNYSVVTETTDNPANASFLARLNQSLSDGKDGWMRNAAGSRGYEYISGSGVPSYEVNITSSVPTYGGKSIRRWHAEYMTSLWLSGASWGFDGLFTDNVFAIARSWKAPSPYYDYNRDGSNEATSSSAGSAINVARRAGHADYIDQLHALNPGLEVWGNTTGHDLDASEYVGKLEGAHLEGHNKYGGTFSQMMARYAAQESNTASPHVVMVEWQGTATDYKTMRFGLAFVLMRGGYYAYTTGGSSLSWFDEFDQPIGEPSEAAQTAARINGCWARLYQNGVVLMNPTSTAQTITKAFLDGLGYSFRRFSGSQDATTNSGAAISADFSLAAGDGLLLLKANVSSRLSGVAGSGSAGAAAARVSASTSPSGVAATGATGNVTATHNP